MRRSRHAGKQPLWLLPPDSLSDTLFPGAALQITSDTVAHVAGITGRSSPAPEWWGRRPRRSFGTGEERPSSPATTEGESHIKAPSAHGPQARSHGPWDRGPTLPSTSEVVRPSEVGRGRLRLVGAVWLLNRRLNEGFDFKRRQAAIVAATAFSTGGLFAMLGAETLAVTTNWSPTQLIGVSLFGLLLWTFGSSILLIKPVRWYIEWARPPAVLHQYGDERNRYHIISHSPRANTLFRNANTIE